MMQGASAGGPLALAARLLALTPNGLKARAFSGSFQDPLALAAKLLALTPNGLKARAFSGSFQGPLALAAKLLALTPNGRGSHVRTDANHCSPPARCVAWVRRRRLRAR